jgi:hypothetical protein
MSGSSKSVQPLRDFLRVLIAPAVWFAHFSFLYGAEALICIEPPPGRGAAMGWTAILATAVALTGVIVLIWRLLYSAKTTALPADRGGAWLRHVSLLLAILSALGIIWTALPTTILPACAF